MLLSTLSMIRSCLMGTSAENSADHGRDPGHHGTVGEVLVEILHKEYAIQVQVSIGRRKIMALPRMAAIYGNCCS